eukprot:2562388-Amphidinium_carterae.1
MSVTVSETSLLATATAPSQLEKLLAGQRRLETHMVELQNTINKLPEVLKPNVPASPRCSGCASFDTRDAIYFNDCCVDLHKTSSGGRLSKDSARHAPNDF